MEDPDYFKDQYGDLDEDGLTAEGMSTTTKNILIGSGIVVGAVILFAVLRRFKK